MDNPVATLSHFRAMLNATEQQNSGLLDQLLGEGEISAKYLLSDGVSETVLRASGVYEYNADQQRLPMKLSLARSRRASGRRIRSRRLRQNCRHKSWRD